MEKSTIDAELEAINDILYRADATRDQQTINGCLIMAVLRLTHIVKALTEDAQGSAQ